jgi:hypothetical protein
MDKMSDNLVAKPSEGKEFEKKPVGELDAVISKVFHLGQQDSKWGPKPTVRVYWETANRMTEGEMKGKRFLFFEDYNFTLGSPDGKKPSNLRKMLKTLFGKDIPPEKLKDGVDLSRLVGHNCRIMTIENGGYVNIDMVLPPRRDAEGKVLVKLVPELPPEWVPPSVQEKRKNQVPQHPDTPAPTLTAAANPGKPASDDFVDDVPGEPAAEPDIF